MGTDDSCARRKEMCVETEVNRWMERVRAGVADPGVSCSLDSARSIPVDEIDETTLLTRDSQDVFAGSSECECGPVWRMGSCGSWRFARLKSTIVVKSTSVCIHCQPLGMSLLSSVGASSAVPLFRYIVDSDVRYCLRTIFSRPSHPTARCSALCNFHDHRQ